MLAVISPAKTLDYQSPLRTAEYSQPEFLNHSEKLIRQLRASTEQELAALMSISDKLAALNAQRYHEWHRPFNQDNSRQAILAFKGDVYQGLELDEWTEEDFQSAQDRLRILSGLYGVLRPLDLMQPYRLEMGTRLKNDRGDNLYQFWGDRITDYLNKAVRKTASPVLLNLASNEYFSSVRRKKLEPEIIEPVFKDAKNGTWKVISFFAKKARGAMADHVIRHRIDDPDDLRKFRGLGYRYNAKLSTREKPVFTREER